MKKAITIKITNSCSQKNTIKKIHRQVTYREKIFTKHKSDKLLIFRKYKEHPQLNNKNTSNLIKHAKDLNSHLTKVDIRMANKPTTKSLTSFVIRKVQIKITVTYHQFWWGCGTTILSCIVDVNGKWYNCFGKMSWQFFK